MLRMNGVIQGLLACALDGQSPAASSTYGVSTLRYFDESRHRWVMFSDGLAVGHGGRPSADGHDAVYFIGQHNFPVEYVEERYPIRFEEYGIRSDSGGPGLHRGGAGIIRQFVFEGDKAMLTTRFDNVRFPPWGVNGGLAGRAGRITLNAGTRQERQVPPIADSIELQRGDRVRLETSGGGGWGHPFDRPVDAVLYDARNGFVTVAGARADYGVAITPSLDVDERVTSDLRADRAGHRMFHRTIYTDNLWPQGEFAATTMTQPCRTNMRTRHEQ
jgi:N-methylhydantoinase B